MRPELPLVAVDRSEDVYLYKDERDLARDLEIVDVENGEYKIFDSSGAVLEISVVETLTTDRPWFLGGRKRAKVLVVQKPIGDPAPEALRGILNRALDYQPTPTTERPADLRGLIQVAVNVLGYSP